MPAVRGRDARAYESFSRHSELPMLVLALLFVPVLLVPRVFAVDETAEAALETAGWLIWAAFAAEYVVKLHLAADKGAMVRAHIIDLVIIVLPFLRPLRALRLLRAGSALGRAGVATNRLLTRRGFRGFLLLVLGVIAVSGALVWLFERAHPDTEVATVVDGVWWALVTATTVGYGDMVPVTAEGRGIAVLLMLLGVALLSVVTANIAAFFVEEDAVTTQDLRRLEDKLDRLAASLNDQAHAQPDAAGAAELFTPDRSRG